MHMENIPPPNIRAAHFALTVDLFERDDIERAVDMLIALLDATDGDADSEDSEAGEHAITADGRDLRNLSAFQTDDDEPSLGIPEAQSGRWGGNVTCGGDTDGELEDRAQLTRHIDRIRATSCTPDNIRDELGRTLRLGWRLPLMTDPADRRVLRLSEL